MLSAGTVTNQAVFTLGLDTFGRLTQVRSTGLNRQYTYDLANQMTGVHSTAYAAAALLGANQNLQHNPIGQIEAIDRGTIQQTMRYDQRGQLNWLLTDGPQRTVRTFAFDLNGNRTEDSLQGPAQYLNDQILQNNSTHFTTDSGAQGRLIASVSGNLQKTFDYGVSGKLKKFKSVDSQCSFNTCTREIETNYVYDGLGRRLAKKISRKSGTGVATNFTHAFTYLGEEDQILLSRDASNKITLLIDHLGTNSRLGDHLGETSLTHRKAYEKDHLGPS